jgi:hypothetical protein
LVEFSATGTTQKFCSPKCRGETYKFKLFPGLEDKTCPCCNIDMSKQNPAKKYCSEPCKVKHKSEVKYSGEEGIDYLVCPICKIRTRQFTTKHAKMHGYSSIKDMKETLGLQSVTCEKKKLFSKGENNPGFNHGGKFSAWSKHFVNGYDEIRHNESKRKHSEWVKSHQDQNTFSIEYWKKQTNGDDALAQKLYKESQTRDLEWFIKKYGEDVGPIKHQEKIKKWLKTLNDKPIEQLAYINSKKIRKSGCFFSKAEKELFHAIKQHVPSLSDQISLYRCEISGTKRFYIYDMFYQDKIIEYNGDFWHANPLVYGSDFSNPYNKLTQQQILEKDKDKLRVAEESGYKVMVVWECDYKKDKTRIIQECIHFLTQ